MSHDRKWIYNCFKSRALINAKEKTFTTKKLMEGAKEEHARPSKSDQSTGRKKRSQHYVASKENFEPQEGGVSALCLLIHTTIVP